VKIAPVPLPSNTALPTPHDNLLWQMRATLPLLLAPWFQPCYAHHRVASIYLSTLLRNNGRYFGNLLETRYSSRDATFDVTISDLMF